MSVAYLSLEIAIHPEILSYHGGLGILAGDILHSACDLKQDVTGFALFCKYGNFEQKLDDFGRQQSTIPSWQAENYMILEDETFMVELEQESVKGQIWRFEFHSSLKGNTNQLPIYFLSALLPENLPKHQAISHQLYATEPDLLLRQQIFFGKAVVQAGLALRKPLFDTYHLNESHDFFVLPELRKYLGSWQAVRERVVLTIHTPLASAHAELDLANLARFLDQQEIQFLQEGLEMMTTAD